MNKIAYIVLLILFSYLCAFLFNTFYEEARNTAIKNTNEAEMIHARQAARGIEEYFVTWTGILNAFSNIDDVIEINAVGKCYIKELNKTHKDEIISISRINERGIIQYSTYSKNIEGIDISGQKHVKDLLRYHKTTVSDVFLTVEGVDGIALHVPVFKGTEFKGSLAILFNFKSLAKRYLDDIKIGKTGYAWVISRDGIQLYSPIKGFTGKSVFETIKSYPSAKPMVMEMLKGHQGVARYNFDTTGDKDIRKLRKYAVYTPVHLGNTFWSIAVASTEQETLSGIISFRNKLIGLILGFFFFGILFLLYGTKAWLIVKEEDKRKKAELQLQEKNEKIKCQNEEFKKLNRELKTAIEVAEENENKFRSYIENAPDGIFILDNNGRCVDTNNSACQILGYSKEEILASTFNDLIAEESYEDGLIHFKDIIETGSANSDLLFKHQDGTKHWLTINAVRLSQTRFLAFAKDINERKHTQERLIKKTTELENLNSYFVGRELRMVELKKEINILLTEAGKERKYEI